MPCFLCTEHADDTVGNIEFASERAATVDLRRIIEQHFWLRVNNTKSAPRPAPISN